MALTASRNGDRGAARLFDVGGAILLLVLSLPLLLVSAAAVALESGRPIFFGHLRLGKGGRPFRCWKLRTMAPNAEARLADDPELRRRYLGNGFKIPSREDPRVTPLGRRLRRTYLDELPQLFNVLAGTMSLVGPRPIVPAELAEYGPDADTLLSVRPGVFGAWTARGRARPGYPDRARLELDYVRGRTLARDVAILVRCVPVVFRGLDES